MCNGSQQAKRKQKLLLNDMHDTYVDWDVLPLVLRREGRHEKFTQSTHTLISLILNEEVPKKEGHGCSSTKSSSRIMPSSTHSDVAWCFCCAALKETTTAYLPRKQEKPKYN
ncbi:hypothetical protein CDAR_59091 [Caerostris darwini]|uniref:Uncharacterized protein n=1 Tax=Caerostris darwini TaxID=1538125 RepID=A0AAV4X3V8_9ARAC|nr:hypothetical protein CDAR_59091 [Caerostris darwini]